MNGAYMAFSLVVSSHIKTYDNEKSAQRRREHCALAVVRRTNKQTHKQTHRQGRLRYTAQLIAQCKNIGYHNGCTFEMVVYRQPLIIM